MTLTGAGMPLLTAIDEYDSTIQAIAAHAETALLSSHPVAQEAALRFILKLCQNSEENITGVLTGPMATLSAMGWLQRPLP